MSDLRENNNMSFLKLRDLLDTFKLKPQDVDLYHWEYDEESITMVELSMEDFTEHGLLTFDKVLNAEVVNIQAYGQDKLSVGVSGVSLTDVQDLASSHAGYCSIEDYNLWFTMDK